MGLIGFLLKKIYLVLNYFIYITIQNVHLNTYKSIVYKFLCAYYDTAGRNLLILLLLLRTALAPYWQSLVHWNCACVYYNTLLLLLHTIEKIKMAESIREMSSEIGDNHNCDLFRLDSSVRIKTRKCAEVT